MNKDKIIGYVQAMANNYVNKYERENNLLVKRELMVIIEDLNDLKEFIEEDEQLITVGIELDSVKIASAMIDSFNKTIKKV